MTTENDPKGGALLHVKKKGKSRSPETPPEFPISLRPVSPARKKGRPPSKRAKPKVITVKVPTDLLDAVDLCVEALREWDPLASRGTVLRVALTSFLGPRGFLPKATR